MSVCFIDRAEVVFAEFIASNIEYKELIYSLVIEKDCKPYDEWELGFRVVVPKIVMSKESYEIFEYLAHIGYGVFRDNDSLVFLVEVIRPILAALLHIAHEQTGIFMPDEMKKLLSQYVAYEDLHDDE